MTPPSKVNLSAFETRLRTIFSAHVFVYEDRSIERRAIDRERETSALGRRVEGTRQIARRGGEISGLVRCVDSPCLDGEKSKSAFASL